MKNRVLTISLIILVSITLIGAIAFILIWQLNLDDSSLDEEPTIDEILQTTVEMPEITTNLASNQFIRLSLTIQTTDRQAAEELEKREFQIKNIVIQELSEITSQDLEGKIGKQTFQETIKSLINPLMQAGEVEQVYIVSYIIQ